MNHARDTITDEITIIENRSILVTVGTDHHPFDRLIEWFDDWTAQQEVVKTVDGFVQRGASRVGNTRSVDFLEFEQLRDAIRAADIVITHGGPGSIMECRRWGRLPIVCPRDPDLGEHVDDHQQLFSKRLAAQGQILIAHTKAEFFAHLDEMARCPRLAPAPDQGHIDRAVNRVADIVHRLVDSGHADSRSTDSGHADSRDTDSGHAGSSRSDSLRKSDR